MDAWRAINPHAKLARGDKHGYVTVALDENRARVRIRAIVSEKNPNSPIATLASFVVENGRPGAEAE
jgi:alkaline phosphatase D